jgi:hypothetical protein
VSDVADLCANMAIINKGHVLLCGEPVRWSKASRARSGRASSQARTAAFQKRHTVISTRLLSGRTLIHVYAERYPGDDFEPIHPTLEDVYFATIAGRHNDRSGTADAMRALLAIAGFEARQRLKLAVHLDLFLRLLRAGAAVDGRRRRRLQGPERVAFGGRVLLNAPRQIALSPPSSARWR